MTASNGHNPMRWNCLEKGCFNHKQRPKLELFCDCFPDRINFGDIDGIVEISGNALLLEWKGDAKELPTGQRIMYQKLTGEGVVTAIILAGDARSMTVSHRRVARRGKLSEWEPAALDDACEYMRRWARWAKQHPQKPVLRVVDKVA
jgi:hypothetical protein